MNIWVFYMAFVIILKPIGGGGGGDSGGCRLEGEALP